MASPKAKFRRRVDNAIDRYAQQVGYYQAELLLQERAQDMHELAIETECIKPICFTDLAGYAGESPAHDDEKPE
jgi:hypothetical protein